MSLTSTPYGGRPGLDIPLNFHDAILATYNKQDLHCITPHHGYFPCAIHPLDLAAYRASIHCLTIREICMMQIMQQITCKPHWNVKIFDEEIVKKWRFEATSNPSADVSEQMLDYIFAELRHEAKTYEKTGHFIAYDLVAISDVTLSASFREVFNKAVRPLEDVPDRMKDWHPGSDDKVLDLVHPSLFPFVYGRTRALEVSESVPLFEAATLCGKGNVIPIPPEEETEIVANSNLGWELNRANYGRKFQWLPCEVDINGPGAKITSYINNLHPITHQPLYNLIEQVIDASIPLWSSVLSRTIHRNDLVLRIYYSGHSDIEDVNPIQQPEPGAFTPRPPTKLDLKEMFGQTGLQVIVKLANIELTPEKPNYEGGSWHIEGQLNERICATALYYYSNENITSSTLAFRQQSDPVVASEADYPQDFHDWLPIIFGASVGDAGVQVLGGVNTLEGRLLTFPNILQHQVQPFQLADPTKKGHRKILALFLVHPNVKIISTANVPCQRTDWWREELDEMGKDSTSQFYKLPRELQDEVFGAVQDFPISLEEAKSLRLELMEERKHVQAKQNRAFAALEFSLCEH